MLSLIKMTSKLWLMNFFKELPQLTPTSLPLTTTNITVTMTTKLGKQISRPKTQIWSKLWNTELPLK